MKILKLIQIKWLLRVIALSFLFCNYSCFTNMKSKEYIVNKIDIEHENSSYGLHHEVWDKALLLKNFSYPWDALNTQKTNFKALYNKHHLFLRYMVNDTNILIYNKSNDKMGVVNSDRVEIFFRKNSKLNEYYCLEVDSNGKAFDYKAKFYRKFDNDWSWPKGHLFTKGERVSEGYIVEITISLESLRNLGLLKNNLIEAGIYRADCIELANYQQKESVFNWATWVNPETEIPDFHVPSSFGILKLK